MKLDLMLQRLPTASDDEARMILDLLAPIPEDGVPVVAFWQACPQPSLDRLHASASDTILASHDCEVAEQAVAAAVAGEQLN
jgi:hypothetical protein